MINSDQLNETHLVEWGETHLVVEPEDLQVELNQVQDLKIYFHNFDERIINDDLNSILEIYSVVEEDLSNKANNQNKKYQKRSFQILMS